MKMVLLILGAALLIAGIVFIGQGSGYFPYPSSSFMINQSRWIYYGAGFAVAGLVLLILATRRKG